jgi:hypothetical protein
MGGSQQGLIALVEWPLEKSAEKTASLGASIAILGGVLPRGQSLTLYGFVN